jgi:membrane protein DedA with SNARE-associated domain
MTALGSTAHLILEYRYLILIPLALIEGPIVAFIAGTLASLGYFDVWVLAAFFFARDVCMDALYYAIGHFGGRTKVAHWALRKIKVTEDHLESVRQLWEKRPFVTMFIGKLSYGIGSTFTTVAGIVNMRFMTFVRYGAIVAALQYWSLLALGYFFGASFGNISSILQNLQYVIGGIGIVIAVYYIFSARMRKKFMAVTEEGESEPSVDDPGTTR